MANMNLSDKTLLEQQLVADNTTEAAFQEGMQFVINFLDSDAFVTGGEGGDGIDSEDIVDGAIITSKLADGSVTTPKLADNAVTVSKIANAQVTNSKLASNSVDSDKIADNAVVTDKILDEAVTNAKLAGSIANDKLTNSSITVQSSDMDFDLDVSLGGTVVIPDMTDSARGLVDPDFTTHDESTTTQYVLANDAEYYRVQSWALSSSEIIPASRVGTTGQNHAFTLTSSDTDDVRAFLSDGASRNTALTTNDTLTVTDTDNSVHTYSYIGNGVAATEDITDAADLIELGVVDAYFADGDTLTLNSENTFSVTSSGIGTNQLANSAVTTVKINDSAVTSAKINDAAVTTAKINDDAVTVAKLNTTADGTDGQALFRTSSGMDWEDVVNENTTYTAGAGLNLSDTEFAVRATDASSVNGIHRVALISSTDTDGIHYDTSLTYIPSSNTLFATNLSGALSGNATTATHLEDTEVAITLTGDVTSSSTIFRGDTDISISTTIPDDSIRPDKLLSSNNPVDGQIPIYVQASNQWTWGEAGSSVAVSDSAPSDPEDGDLWYDSLDSFRLMMWAEDVSAWVDASPAGADEATAVATVSDTAPSEPFQGQMWYDNGTARMYIFDTDADAWIDASPAAKDDSIEQTQLQGIDTDTDADLQLVSDGEGGFAWAAAAGGGGAPAGTVNRSISVPNSNTTLTSTIPANSGWLRVVYSGSGNNSFQSASWTVGTGTSNSVTFAKSGDNEESYTGRVSYIYWS